MRHSKQFKKAQTVRTLYFALVRSHLNCSSVIWNPLYKQKSENLEQIQNRLLKYLHYKAFGFYDDSLTYVELSLGYQMSPLGVRRDLTLLLLLRDILCSRIDSPPLLERIGFYASSRTNRASNLFHIPMARTVLSASAPLNKSCYLHNKIIHADKTIYIFFDNRKKFAEKVTEALMKTQYIWIRTLCVVAHIRLGYHRAAH